MSSYYNEHDPKAAAWLRELIKAGLIPDGDVDERSITEINSNELYPYTQCHFFAGIGGWSLALQLAGVPATTRLWTGSCPCQPFSSAGKGLAQADERHLWPTFFDLIKECKPDFVFGEQVASAIGKGWLDGVSSDLESEGYACGSVVLGAHSVGAPHIRQRLYWVADSDGSGSQPRLDTAQTSRHGSSVEPNGAIVRLADSSGEGYEWGERSRETGEEGPSSGYFSKCRSNIWSDFCIANCRDGKTRRIPTEPAFFPLANGIPARMVRLRGYGNAIVPQVAAEFIEAFISTLESTPTNE